MWMPLSQGDNVVKELRQLIKGDIVTPDVETWIKFHKWPRKGHYVDACFKQLCHSAKGATLA